VPSGEPFPRLNDRRFFDRLLLALRIAEWAVPAAFLAGAFAVAYLALK